MTALQPLPNPLAGLAQVRIGPPQNLGAVTALPLFGPATPLDADLLEEATAEGRSDVGEVAERGVVKRVLVTHRGTRPLLLVDGEHVQGAKQDRVFNSSVVVAPGATTELPVSCVERGRWRYTQSNLSASRTTLSSVARSRKLRRVTESTLSGRSYDADQGAVWRDVDDYLERSRVRSPTASYFDGYRSRQRRIESQLRSLEPQPGQVGLAVYLGSRLITLDVFGSPSLYARGWKKIARGILAEIYQEQSSESAPTDQCARLLANLSRARSESVETIEGCGPTVHGKVSGAVYGAATYDGHLYHAIVTAA